jgi:hypothetical protein
MANHHLIRLADWYCASVVISPLNAKIAAALVSVPFHSD